MEIDYKVNVNVGQEMKKKNMREFKLWKMEKEVQSWDQCANLANAVNSQNFEVSSKAEKVSENRIKTLYTWLKQILAAWNINIRK